jgi:hypothetical protein
MNLITLAISEVKDDPTTANKIALMAFAAALPVRPGVGAKERTPCGIFGPPLQLHDFFEIHGAQRCEVFPQLHPTDRRTRIVPAHWKNSSSRSLPWVQAVCTFSHSLGQSRPGRADCRSGHVGFPPIGIATDFCGAAKYRDVPEAELRRPARCSAGRKVRPAKICALGISAQLARFRKCSRWVPMAPRSPQHTSPASVALARLAET